jgi:acetolactate synthase small subunit
LTTAVVTVSGQTTVGLDPTIADRRHRLLIHLHDDPDAMNRILTALHRIHLSIEELHYYPRRVPATAELVLQTRNLEWVMAVLQKVVSVVQVAPICGEGDSHVR